MSDGAVYRVDWHPGSDQLVGRCHCGARTVATDPIEVWQWLLGHPVGHSAAPADREPALAAASS